VDVTV